MMTSQHHATVNARFELTFTSALHRSPAVVVVVHRTSQQGSGGHPIYSDESGVFRAEISDRAEVRMLSTSATQRLRRPSSCRPLPAEDGAVAA